MMLSQNSINLNDRIYAKESHSYAVRQNQCQTKASITSSANQFGFNISEPEIYLR